MTIQGNQFRKPVRVDLTDGLFNLDLNYPGHYFRITAVSSANVRVFVSVNEPDGNQREMKHGEGWVHNPFTILYVNAAAQPGEWVEFSVGGNPANADVSRLELFTASDENFTKVISSEAEPVHVQQSGSSIVQIDGQVAASEGLRVRPDGFDVMQRRLNQINGVENTSNESDWTDVVIIAAERSSVIDFVAVTTNNSVTAMVGLFEGDSPVQTYITQARLRTGSSVSFWQGMRIPASPVGWKIRMRPVSGGGSYLAATVIGYMED
ncbi:hypothetical protein [Poriferisphaera sp. WC338]|uniref:hypothetical protein n=1 Tax=Poriferisphaera sp. WC338 TaxID=3425129 RepID=UPI003D819499